MAKTQIALTINGRQVEALVEPRTLLIHFLREQQMLTGAHIGCETTHCGACTVDMDGKSVKSCTVFAVQAEGAAVTTIEGMAAPDGTLHALQERSEEHTSELQSLMRISYAVFGLKKQTHHTKAQ